MPPHSTSQFCGLTSWKKKVALLAWSAAWESMCSPCPVCALRIGVAESFLMSCRIERMSALYKPQPVNDQPRSSAVPPLLGSLTPSLSLVPTRQVQMRGRRQLPVSASTLSRWGILYLLESLIVDKTCGILGHLELPLLYLLAELPAAVLERQEATSPDSMEAKTEEVDSNLSGRHTHMLKCGKTAASYTLDLDSVSRKRMAPWLGRHTGGRRPPMF
jgi:hypothetical protein